MPPARGYGAPAQQWYLSPAQEVEQAAWVSVCTAVRMMATTEHRKGLPSQCLEDNYRQQRPLFAGVLVAEAEVEVCLSRMRWQLARERSALGLRDALSERRREYSCFERSAYSTAKRVRCAKSSRYAGQGGPAALQRIRVSVGGKRISTSTNERMLG